MKKYDVLLLISALAFSGLFYEQSPGVNFPFFTILLSATVALLRVSLLTSIQWWSYCAFMNVAALSVFINNSDISIITTVFATVVFSSKSFSPSTSTLLNLGFGFYSLARSPFDLLAGSYTNFTPVTRSGRSRYWIVASGVFTAILLSVLFLMLYRASNPLFDQFVSQASFQWLSIGFLLFTMFSFILVNGLLNSKTIGLVTDLDTRFSRDITKDNATMNTLNFDVVIAVTLFSILNLMLLILNIIDAKYIYIIKELPEGITLSEFVHDAVAANIFSMAVAAGLITWLFRGELNFVRYGKLIRVLAYSWIAQSILVTINTLIRNTWYIQEYQLTGSRIGVFVFLLLSLIGLFTTYYKLRHKKSAWWFVASNFQAWFVVLVILSLINWDKRITNYNIRHTGTNKTLDINYLVSLSHANLPQLVELHNSGTLTREERLMVYKKINRAIEYTLNAEWPSYNIRLKQSEQALLDLDLNKKGQQY